MMWLSSLSLLREEFDRQKACVSAWNLKYMRYILAVYLLDNLKCYFFSIIQRVADLEKSRDEHRDARTTIAVDVLDFKNSPRSYREPLSNCRILTYNVNNPNN